MRINKMAYKTVIWYIFSTKKFFNEMQQRILYA